MQMGFWKSPIGLSVIIPTKHKMHGGKEANLIFNERLMARTILRWSRRITGSSRRSNVTTYHGNQTNKVTWDGTEENYFPSNKFTLFMNQLDNIYKY